MFRPMAKARTRDLTREQNEKVRKMARELLAAGATQTELAHAVHLDRSAVSGFLGGRQGVSYTVAIEICRMAGKDPKLELGLTSVRESVDPAKEVEAYALETDFPAWALPEWRSRTRRITSSSKGAPAKERLYEVLAQMRREIKSGELSETNVDAPPSDAAIAEPTAVVDPDAPKSTRKRASGRA